MGAGSDPISAQGIVVFRSGVIREFTLEPGQQDLMDWVELDSERHDGNNSTRFPQSCWRNIAISLVERRSPQVSFRVTHSFVSWGKAIPSFHAERETRLTATISDLGLLPRAPIRFFWVGLQLQPLS